MALHDAPPRNLIVFAFVLGCAIGWVASRTIHGNSSIAGVPGLNSTFRSPEQSPLTDPLQAQLTRLTSEIARLKSENEQLRAGVQSAPPSSTPTEPHANGSSRDFIASQRVKGVQKLIALTEEESERLSNELQQHPEESLKAALTQTIGETRTAQYLEAKEQLDRDAEAEEDQTELFRLSRKLALTPEQENALRDVITSLRTELRPMQKKLDLLAERATLLHSASPSDTSQSELRNIYEEMKITIQQTNDAKRNAMRERLKTNLSDEQLNQLILLQEKDRNQFFE